jgi:hypothetical protein
MDFESLIFTVWFSWNFWAGPVEATAGPPDAALIGLYGTDFRVI